MKRFLIKLFCFAGANLLIVAVAFAVYLKRYPPQESFYMASLDKHSLIQTQASPRLIFIGGSSMALGMDSGFVARRNGFHPVNMGLNMGIGLEFMLNEVGSSLRRGDVVVVAPEYQTFEQHYRAEPEYLARLLECRPALVRVLSWSQFKSLLDQGYLHHIGRILRTVARLPERIIEVHYPHSRRRSFNENGDIVSHHGIEGQRGPPARFKFTASGSTDGAIAHLNRFAAECRRRGVQLFFSHPPYEERVFHRNRDSIARLENQLRERLAIPMLDEPGELAFPSEDFFDTEFHLNLRGKIKRSEFVAERLALALTNSAPRLRQ